MSGIKKLFGSLQNKTQPAPSSKDKAEGSDLKKEPKEETPKRPRTGHLKFR